MALSKKEKLLQAAQKNIQKGQWLKAAKDFQKVLELDPKDIRSRQRLGELFSRAGCKDEALEAYGAVAKSYGDNGFYLKAIAVYKQMQKIDPSRAEFYKRLAVLNEKQGLVGNALGEYRQLAELYEKTGDVKSLTETLEKMVELDPENSGLRLRVLHHFLKNGLLDKARAGLQDLLALLERLKDAATVIRLKELIQAHLAGDVDAKAGVGRVLVACNQPEEAVALLAGETTDHPDHKALLVVLASANRQMKDYSGEARYYEMLLVDEPQNLDYQEAFARACLDAGDDQQALDRLEDWKSGFLQGDRAAVLKDFYEQLQVMRCEDESVKQTLHQIYEATGEGGKLFDLLSDDQQASDAKNPAGDEPDAPGEWFGSDLLNAGEGEALTAAEQETGVFDEDILSPAGVPGEGPPPGKQVPASWSDGEEAPLADPSGGEDDVFGEMPSDHSLIGDGDEEGFELELELELDVSEEACLLEDLPEVAPTGESAQGPVEADPVEADPVEVDPVEAEPAEVDLAEVDLAEVDLAEVDLAEVDLVEAEPVESDLNGAIDGISGAAEDLPSSFPGGGDEVSGIDDGLADLQRELGEVFEMDSFDLDDDDDEPDVSSDLEETEFYLQQGFLDEALEKCRSLLASHPRCSEARELLAQVEERMTLKQAAPTPEPVAPEPEPEIPEDVLPASADRDQIRLEGNISAFKKGIEDAVAQDDCETHYDLGIAYKEMGLLDEAIGEFSKAMGHPSRYIDALTLTGICMMSKGDFERAAELFKQGLRLEKLAENDRLNLYFELGQLYVVQGRPLEALESFQQVADADISFRDVGDHICRLRSELGLDDGGDIGGPAGGPGSNRVSYL